MSAWILLTIAILANASTNICLRAAARSVETKTPLGIAQELLLSPMAWLGVISGFVLLGTYMAAIRQLPLSVSYAIVTIMSMVVLIVWGGFTGTEALNVKRFIGMGLVILGTVTLVASTSDVSAAR